MHESVLHIIGLNCCHTLPRRAVWRSASCAHGSNRQPGTGWARSDDLLTSGSCPTSYREEIRAHVDHARQSRALPSNRRELLKRLTE
jgi:hypothetical protein